jgi:hypothetical protein
MTRKESLIFKINIHSDPQSVNDWMHEELDGKDSVNFPGKSKDNYHSMVFDPNQNVSIRYAFFSILVLISCLYC